MRDRRHPRDELIAIALELLDDHHPEDLSMREVARRAGLTSGAPSHHFGNKLGLLAASAAVAWRDLYEQMAQVDEGATPEEGLRHKARAYIAFARSRPGPYRLIMSRLFKDKQQFSELATWPQRTMESVTTLVAKALGETGDEALPKRRGLAVWALLHGHVTLVLDGGFPAALVDVITHDVCRMAVEIALLPPLPGDLPTPKA